MGIQIFPDIEAKKEKLRANKEKKRQKKAEKAYKARRKYMLKKKTFAKQFIKNALVLLGLGLIIAIPASVLYIKNEINKAKTEYNLWQTGVINAFNTAEIKAGQNMDKNPEDILYGELRMQMLSNNCPICHDFSATVYKVDGNIDVFCDSLEGVCYGRYLKGDVSDIYCCEEDAFGDLLDDLILWEHEFDKNDIDSHYVDVEDYYLSDRVYKPGKVSVYEVDQNSGIYQQSTRVEYDFTPSDIKGYTHYISEEEKQKTREMKGGMLFVKTIGGTRKNSKAYKYTNEIDISYTDDANFSMSTRNDGKEFDEFCLDITDGYESVLSFIPVEYNGNKYFISTRGYFLFYELYLKKLLAVFGIGAAILVLLALVIARLQWSRIKTEYEVNEYRKMITDSMAHDLKSPLMAVSASAENLRDNVHTEKKDYYADVILSNVDYMNEIIEHILTLSKSENKKQAIKFEIVKVNEIIEEVVSKYQPLIEKENLDVCYQDLGTIQGDKILLTQAFDNLINNAIKFSAKGGTIEIIKEGKYLQISNEFEGAENLDTVEIMKPFHKADKSRGNKNGSGLGLSISKNLLAANGIPLEVEVAAKKFTAKMACYHK